MQPLSFPKREAKACRVEKELAILANAADQVQTLVIPKVQVQ